MKKNWKTALMASVAGFALIGGFWGDNQEKEQKLDGATLMEGIVNISQTENITNRNIIVDAFLQTSKTITGRKLLEQMYDYYGTNDHTRINVAIDDIGFSTGAYGANKITFSKEYLPDGLLKILDSTDIRVTAAHELLHALQDRERGVSTDIIGNTYEDDFKENKLMEAEAKIQNIVMGNELKDDASSLYLLYNYMTNKLNNKFSQDKSESMVKTALFQCLWQNKTIENVVASCLGENISITDLKNNGISLECCNKEIKQWHSVYNKQAIKMAYSNEPLRIDDIPGFTPNNATQEQQKKIYQSYLSRLNKNGIVVSMDDIQNGFKVEYQEREDSAFEGIVTIKDSQAEHCFKSCFEPTEINTDKKVKKKGGLGILGILSQCSQKGASYKESENKTSEAKVEQEKNKKVSDLILSSIKGKERP